jgi:hypothetical protein
MMTGSLPASSMGHWRMLCSPGPQPKAAAMCAASLALDARIVSLARCPDVVCHLGHSYP